MTGSHSLLLGCILKTKTRYILCTTIHCVKKETSFLINVVCFIHIPLMTENSAVFSNASFCSGPTPFMLNLDIRVFFNPKTLNPKVGHFKMTSKGSDLLCHLLSVDTTMFN